jgi:hypothetical protein
MGQVSFQGIRGCFPPDAHQTCYPCNRSTLLPFYPVRTDPEPSTRKLYQPFAALRVTSTQMTIFYLDTK